MLQNTSVSKTQSLMRAAGFSLDGNVENKLYFCELSHVEKQIGSLHSQSAAYFKICTTKHQPAKHSHTEPTVLSENDNPLSAVFGTEKSHRFNVK